VHGNVLGKQTETLSAPTAFSKHAGTMGGAAPTIAEGVLKMF
jgi:hypothetical protein